MNMFKFVQDDPIISAHPHGEHATVTLHPGLERFERVLANERQHPYHWQPHGTGWELRGPVVPFVKEQGEYCTQQKRAKLICAYR